MTLGPTNSPRSVCVSSTHNRWFSHSPVENLWQRQQKQLFKLHCPCKNLEMCPRCIPHHLNLVFHLHIYLHFSRLVFCLAYSLPQWFHTATTWLMLSFYILSKYEEINAYVGGFFSCFCRDDFFFFSLDKVCVEHLKAKWNSWSKSRATAALQSRSLTPRSNLMQAGWKDSFSIIAKYCEPCSWKITFKL